MKAWHRCLLVIGALATVLLPALPADAHSVLVRSDPAGGATLDESPGLAELWFSQDVVSARSSAQLVDGTGTVVPGTSVVANSGDPRALALTLPQLSTGTYGLVWQVAGRDGHQTSGTLVFGIGASTALTTTTEAGASGLLRRWAGLVTLAGVIGPAAVCLAVLRRRTGVVGVARRRLLVVVEAAAALGLLLRLADLQWGQRWIATEVLLVLAVMAAEALRRTAWRWLPWAFALLTAGLVWVEALGSHAQALTDGRAAALVALATHAFAGLLWMGAVPALVVVLWPSAGRTELIRWCRTPFSLLMAGSFVVVVSTGLFSAGVEVASVTSLATTTYGRLLLLKTALLLSIGGLGLLNATRLRTGLRRVVGLIAVEAGVGLVLLAAVGALTGQSPPLTAVDDGQSEQARTGTAEDLVVTASATPNRPGINWFTVLAESTRRPAPGPIDGISVRITTADGSQQLALRPLTAGRYFTTYRMDSAGPLRLTVLVQRDGRRYAVDLGWPMAPAVQLPPVDRGRRLAPYADLAALLLLEATVVAGAWWLLRSGRRRPLQLEERSR